MKFSIEPNFRRGPSLAEQVAEFLSGEIKRGSFQKSEVLPSEAELTYRFNVSRTVVREALSRLKNDGLLESSQGRRTKVAKNSEKVFFRFKGIRKKSTESLTAAFEFHALLEADAAALAAQRRTMEDLDRMYLWLEQLNMALREGHEGTNANVEFHQAFIDASQNQMIIEFISFLSDQLYKIIQADSSQSSNLPLTEESYQEHVAIYDSIAKGDPITARSAIMKHRMNAGKRRGIHI